MPYFKTLTSMNRLLINNIILNKRGGWGGGVKSYIQDVKFFPYS